MVDINEAIKCPKCGQEGIKQSEKPGPRGSKIFIIHCQNVICPWLSTGWAVQMKSDGTVYERQKGPKMFHPLTSTDKAIAERMIREVKGERD